MYVFPRSALKWSEMCYWGGWGWTRVGNLPQGEQGDSMYMTFTLGLAGWTLSWALHGQDIYSRIGRVSCWTGQWLQEWDDTDCMTTDQDIHSGIARVTDSRWLLISKSEMTCVRELPHFYVVPSTCVHFFPMFTFPSYDTRYTLFCSCTRPLPAYFLSWSCVWWLCLLSGFSSDRQIR
jgi:hypothetical protein